MHLYDEIDVELKGVILDQNGIADCNKCKYFALILFTCLIFINQLYINIRNMGNFQCEKTCLSYDRINWEIVSTHPYGQIVRNIRDQQIVMEKWITVQSCNLADYQWRKQAQQSFIPRVYDCSHNSKWISSTMQTGCFIITTPMIPLAQCRQLDIQQTVFLLKEVLIGIQYLQDKFGYFGIESNMIYISSFGRPIVWINPNLASNTPKISYKASQYKQQVLLRDIFTIVSKKLTPRCQLPISIKNKNIQQTIRQLKQYLYIIDSHIILIEKIQSATYLEEKIKHLEKNRITSQKRRIKSSKIIMQKQIKHNNNQQQQLASSTHQEKPSLYGAWNKKTYTGQTQDDLLSFAKKSITTQPRDPDEMLEDLMRTQGIIFGNQ